MQIIHGEKLSQTNLQSWRFSSDFCLSYYKVFDLLYNRESFPTNNKKIMQPRNFSTANDLHYTVYIKWCKIIGQIGNEKASSSYLVIFYWN